LGTKKYRQKYNKFIVEGHKSCIEFINSGKYQITDLFASDSWLENNRFIIHNKSINSIAVNSDEMKSISHFTTPSSVMLVCDIEEDVVANVENENKIIYLDGIQDPGNFGTIIRIADWFGINVIICSKDTVDKYNPKVISGSMGSFVNVSIIEDDIDLVTKIQSTHSFICADMEGCHINEFTFPKKSVLCLGNEGHGFSEDIIKMRSHTIAIPGARTKIAESLNVGVAAAIICSKWL
jgi:TrmH family RNA methyltransferase